MLGSQILWVSIRLPEATLQQTRGISCNGYFRCVNTAARNRRGRNFCCCRRSADASAQPGLWILLQRKQEVHDVWWFDKGKAMTWHGPWGVLIEADEDAATFMSLWLSELGHVFTGWMCRIREPITFFVKHCNGPKNDNWLEKIYCFTCCNELRLMVIVKVKMATGKNKINKIKKCCNDLTLNL